eukprot:TRINITY_DN6567_c0_g2_i1.p1 TRINITY_DN6567_c0_g2~~TRINITY_DN6567_c0_g2_i1.p1  ORF type:complete len:281 (-),score=15.23 TRINITY_DN6567_c0_g2_i1:99-941(-)
MLRQNPKTTITFIRHAQSLYNLAQMQAKESNAEVRGDYDFKTDTREDLIDCDLTEQGMKECEATKMKLENISFSIVIVSPLKRSLRSADLMLRDHPSHPKFIVCPLFAEFTVSTCDLNGALEDSMKEFSWMDFKWFSKYENPLFWHLEHLGDKELVREVSKRIEPFQDNVQRAYQEIAKLIAQKGRGFTFESPSDWERRIDFAKRYLRELIGNEKPAGKVAVVSHGCFIERFTAKGIDVSGRPINPLWIPTCGFSEYTFQLTCQLSFSQNPITFAVFQTM